MNKIANYLKNILVIPLVILVCLLMQKHGFPSSFSIILYIILVIIVVGITIHDRKRIMSTQYCLLFIAIIVLNIFLLIRSLYDPNFICNSKEYMDLIVSYDKGYYSNNLTDFNEISLLYFIQNIYWLVVLFISLFIYRYVEFEARIFNFNPKVFIINKISWIYLGISIILTYAILKVFSMNLNGIPSSILFFLLNTILVIAEITYLKRHREKRNYLMYLCFFFNLCIYIAVFS